MSGKYQQFTSYQANERWHTPAYAYDGDPNTAAWGGTIGDRLELVLNNLYEITHIFVKGKMGDNNPSAVSIDVWAEDVGWVNITSNVTLSNTETTSITLGQKLNVWRVSITRVDNLPQDNLYIYDCQVGCVPDAAVCVSPADDAEGIAANTPLSWTGEDELTDTYKVYLGTDNPPTNIVNGHSQAPADPNTYTPAVNLDYATKYYWRIDAVNEAGTTQGTVQSFTTALEFCRVYRGQDGNIDYDNAVAVMGLNDAQVSIPNQVLPSNTIWYFIRRRVAPCGLESADSPACIVRIDSAGSMIPEMPNTPQSITVNQLEGGKFLVRWRYTTIDHEIAPTEFRIYVDSGSGFNFTTPTAVVNYKLGGRGEFTWESGAYTHGQRIKFCVRAYAQEKGETQNTDHVAAVADALGPEAITDVYATVEQLP